MKCVKATCKECPFRKDSIKGYLGEASYDPETFLEQLEFRQPIPCHMTVNWQSDNFVNEMRKAPACIGALQFMNNSCKLSRFKKIMDLQDKAGKNNKIFMWSADFIKYHKKYLKFH